MKWTRNEEIEFDPDQLPYEVYAALIDQLISEASISLLEGGRLCIYHAFLSDYRIGDRQMLQDAMKDFVEYEEQESLIRMLATIDESRAIVAAALAKKRAS